MKKINTIFSLATASIATFASISLGVTFSNVHNLPLSSENTNVNLKAIGTTTETATTAHWKYSASGIKQWENYGKMRPNQINEEQIKSLINFGHPSATINIEIQKIEEKHLTNGYIEFKVVQTINEFTDGIPSGSKTVNIKKPENIPTTDNDTSGSTSATEEIWSTNVYPGLLISDKYNFQWRSVDEISQFLESTDKTYDTLTVEDVLLNMVERGDNFKLPSTSSIQKKAVTANEADDKKYGVMKLTIQFSDATDTNQWVNGIVPDETERTYTIRGLKSTESSISTTMDFVEKNQYEVAALEINTKMSDNPLNNYLVGPTNNLTGALTNLFPSELVNFGGTDNNALLSLLTQGLYLSGTDNKTAQLMYYGKNINDADFATKTGLSTTDISQIGINSVHGIADDSKGSLQLEYKYNKYDVYSNKIVTEEKTTTYPEGTFQVNPDANKTLQFSWKNDSSLIGISSSFKVVNDFESNKDDIEFVKILSNQFINGSFDVYSKYRNVDISFSNGQKVTNGTVVPTSSENNTKIKVSLIFDSWSGERYTDDFGIYREGFKTEKEFTLKNYNSSISGITWKTQEEVKAALGGDISKTSVIELADKLFSKEIPLSTFVTGADNKIVNYDVTPSTGSISISIQDNNTIESNVYTGFLIESLNSVTQFSWSPVGEVSPVLLSTNLNSVTKELVIDEYLSKLPSFAGQVINPDDVQIEPNESNRSLLVEVNLSKYNQEYIDSNRDFKIELRGFIQTEITNGNSYVAPLDLTVILSAILGLVVSIALIVTLIVILVKRAKLNKQEKSHVKK